MSKEIDHSEKAPNGVADETTLRYLEDIGRPIQNQGSTDAQPQVEQNSPRREKGQLAPEAQPAIAKDAAAKTKETLNDIAKLDQLADQSTGPEEISYRERALTILKTSNPNDSIALAIRHIDLSEKYKHLNKRDLFSAAKHLSQAEFYWQKGLENPSMDEKWGDDALKERNYRNATEFYTRALTELDKTLLNNSSRKAPSPANPLAARYYEKIARAHLANDNNSVACLEETSVNYQSAIDQLREYYQVHYNLPSNQDIESLNKQQLLIEFKLIEKSRKDPKNLSAEDKAAGGDSNHVEHLQRAANLIDKLDMNLTLGADRIFAQRDNSDTNNQAFISVFKEIAEYCARKNNHRQAAEIYESIYSMQTKQGADKSDRIETLQQISNEYFSIDDLFNGIKFYEEGVKLAGSNKDLYTLLKPPMIAPLLRDMHKGAFADIEAQKLFEFGKNIKDLADKQYMHESTEKLATDNYISAMQSLRAALYLADGPLPLQNGSKLDCANLVDVLAVVNISAEPKNVPLLREQCDQLCQEVYRFANRNYTVQDKNLLPLCLKLADFYNEQRQYPAAVPILITALAVAKDQSREIKEIAYITKNLANALAESKDVATAIFVCQNFLKYAAQAEQNKQASWAIEQKLKELQAITPSSPK